MNINIYQWMIALNNISINGIWLECYELGPCHCFIILGVSWYAMLKMTGVDLELISDIDMYIFVAKGMRYF